jgi:hypothetical protein
MSNAPVKIGMKPPHPGDFIRTEILEALDLSIVRAAVRSGEWQSAPVPGNGPENRTSLRRIDGYAAPHAGVV